MKENLLRLLENNKSLTLEMLVANILMAVVVGFIIYLSYWLSHSGSVYSKKFNVSLVMLTVITATVMAVIGNNVALSLGMVGALSIVRYRTAIKDSRDTAYIFWGIVGGICCGAGEYLIAAVGTATIFLVLLLLGRIKSDNRLLLVIRGELELERPIEALIFKSFEKKAVLRVKNTTPESIEFIYEISDRIYAKVNSSSSGLISSIYALGKIQYANIVVQNEEIV